MCFVHTLNSEVLIILRLGPKVLSICRDTCLGLGKFLASDVCFHSWSLQWDRAQSLSLTYIFNTNWEVGHFYTAPKETELCLVVDTDNVMFVLCGLMQSPVIRHCPHQGCRPVQVCPHSAVNHALISAIFYGYVFAIHVTYNHLGEWVRLHNAAWYIYIYIVPFPLMSLFPPLNSISPFLILLILLILSRVYDT